MLLKQSEMSNTLAIKMNKRALLALTLFGFVQMLDLNIDDEDMKILKFIGLNVDPSSEELQFSLKSAKVSLVLNPSHETEPPKFAVSIFRNGTLIGAGVIISGYFILTLCSLLMPKKNTKDDLVASTKLQYPFFNSPNDDMDIHSPTIRKMISHPGCISYYKIDPLTNVGLIETKEVMLESASLKYPKLPTFHIPEEEAKFMISNFRVNNPTAMDLKEAIWYIITKPAPNALCKKLFKADRQKYREGNICVSYVHVGDGDECKGDIGAPLSMRYKNQDILIGLNMHKHQCGQPREVAAFVCVKSNKNWIENTMKLLKSNC